MIVFVYGNIYFNISYFLWLCFFIELYILLFTIYLEKIYFPKILMESSNIE